MDIFRSDQLYLSQLNLHKTVMILVAPLTNEGLHIWVCNLAALTHCLVYMHPVGLSPYTTSSWQPTSLNLALLGETLSIYEVCASLLESLLKLSIILLRNVLWPFCVYFLPKTCPQLFICVDALTASTVRALVQAQLCLLSPAASAHNASHATSVVCICAHTQSVCILYINTRYHFSSDDINFILN